MRTAFSISRLNHVGLTIAVAVIFCVSSLSMSSASVNVTSTDESGPGSLRDAIASLTSGGSIVVSNIAGMIILNSELAITNDITIAGLGAKNLNVNGGSVTRLFNITAGAHLTLSEFTLDQGWTMDGMGGAILMEGHETLGPFHRRSIPGCGPFFAIRQRRNCDSGPEPERVF